jgi:ABC-type microcin C transport system duplicated ATPase subunit YejF
MVSGASLAILDEPLDGLDAIGAAAVLELLRDYRARDGVAMLLVTANIAVAQALADDILVIRDRAVVERGSVTEVLRNPQDSYTKSLIAAATPARLAALPSALRTG